MDGSEQMSDGFNRVSNCGHLHGKDADGDACFKCYPRARRDQPIGWIGPVQPPV